MLKKALKRRSGESGGAADGDTGNPAPKQWSHKQMDKIQTRLELTDNQVLLLGKEIREKDGPKSVEPHLRDHLVEKKQMLAEYFTAEPVTYQKGKSGTVTVPTFYCKDVVGLIRNAIYLTLAVKLLKCQENFKQKVISE